MSKIIPYIDGNNRHLKITTGECPRCCNKEYIKFTNDMKKIYCTFCNNWEWLEDSIYSSWINIVEKEEKENSNE